MKFMDYAIEQAKKAFDNDEVPVGAVISIDGKVIAAKGNTSEAESDCTCHAEINAIREACRRLNSKTLENCEMYVSLEPCAMCAGAIINARIKRLYIAAPEPKTGCCGSKADLMKSGLFNHNTEVYWGFSEDESKDLLQAFFNSKRKKD